MLKASNSNFLQLLNSDWHRSMNMFIHITLIVLALANNYDIEIPRIYPFSFVIAVQGNINQE